MSVAGHRLWVFAAIVVLAAALRLPALDVRPMHTDEAVHAAKFARLLQQGLYEYDPEEYHGPTLNYLTLIPARVRASRPTRTSTRSPCAACRPSSASCWWPPTSCSCRSSGSVRRLSLPSSRCLARDGLLQPVLYPGDAPGCFQLRRAHLHLPLSADASRVLGGRSGCVGGADGRDERDVGDRIRVDGGGARVLVGVEATAAGSRPADGSTANDGSSCRSRPDGARRVGPALFVLLQPAARDRRRGGGVHDVRGTAGSSSWHIHPWHYYFGLLLYAGSEGGPVWTEAAIVVSPSSASWWCLLGKRVRAVTDRCSRFSAPTPC